MSGGVLYLVATPLGNLEDVSKRASDCLATADVIYAEDTRRTKVLLTHFGIGDRRLRSLHEHNERARAKEVLEDLDAGQAVALVSDAGTPAVSDPGAELVDAVVRAGHTVTPIPGPSALAAALSVAGFVGSSTDVLFLGFLPTKGRARKETLERIAAHAGVAVLYEGPHRIAATLHDVAAPDAERRLCVCRELTKLHEEILHGTAAELAAWAEGEVRGELTVVIGPCTDAEPKRPEEAAVDAALRRCLDAGLSARDAATAVASVLELPRRQVYKRCQQLTNSE